MRGASAILSISRWSTPSGWTGRNRCCSTRPIAVRCACRMAHCSTATGTIVIRHGMNPGLRTLKPPVIPVVRRTGVSRPARRGNLRMGLLVPLAARSCAAGQHPYDAIYPHRFERILFKLETLSPISQHRKGIKRRLNYSARKPATGARQ